MHLPLTHKSSRNECNFSFYMQVYPDEMGHRALQHLATHLHRATPSSFASLSSAARPWSSSSGNLLQRRRSSHSSSSRSRSIDKSTVLKKCPYCDYTSHNIGHLKRHLASHSSEKPYACPICPHRCNQKANLQTHMITHTSYKPFQCSFCDFRANLKGNVKKHEKKFHSRELQLLAAAEEEAAAAVAAATVAVSAVENVSAAVSPPQ